MHFLTWIADYQGERDFVREQSTLLLQNGDRIPGELVGGIHHRLGRSLVADGTALTANGKRSRGRQHISHGAAELALGRKLIEEADRRSGRPQNPFGPLWEAQAAIALDKSSAASVLHRQREVAKDRPEIAPHVALVEAKWLRLRGNGVSYRMVEEIDEAIATWASRSYRRGGCELLFERAEALRSRRDPGARDALLVCARIAEYLNHPVLREIRHVLLPMGLDYDDPRQRERQAELCVDERYTPFFETFMPTLDLSALSTDAA